MTNLQFLTHATARFTDLEEIAMALEGGCRWIQLRMKEASDAEMTVVGRAAATMCHDQGAVLILDDRVSLCRATGADGVHLGSHDMPVEEARARLGRHAIIGATVNTREDLLRAVRAGADYAGCGPFRFTTTKARLAPFLGIEGYRALVAAKKAYGSSIPLFAIGGITINNIDPLLDTGIDGVALSGCVVSAADPVAEMRRLRIAVDGWHSGSGGQAFKQMTKNQHKS